MGINNKIIFAQQKKFTTLRGKVAFLGFSSKPKHFNTNNYDLYDIILDNFNINNKWELNCNYDTIICYRTLLFCNNYKYFFKKCYDHLNKEGDLFIDFCLGSMGVNEFNKIGHSIGFYKNFIQQICKYTNIKNEKIICPCITSYWNETLINYPDFKKFCEKMKKHGYNDIKKNIYEEVDLVV